MVYHTFVSGEVLTAANVMNDLMNQSVISCTSGTRPASPVAGMTVYETDTGNISVYSGTAWNAIGISLASGAWATWTPTVTASVTNPTNLGAATGRYRTIGKTVSWEVFIQSSNTMTVGSGVYSISLPVATVNTGEAKRHVGAGAFTTDNSTVYFPGACVVESAGGSTFTVWFSSGSHRMANTDWGADLVHYFIASGTYESA